MLSKIWGLVALMLVLGASYTLWKSGVQLDTKTELTTEINQQTEIEVKKDETKVERIFIDGSDDDVIDSVVGRVLAADPETDSYDGELRSAGEDTTVPARLNTQGSPDVELQDGSGVAQTSEQDAVLAPIDDGVSGEALILTVEEMEAAQQVLGDGCISEVIYLDSGLTKTVETCPENLEHE